MRPLALAALLLAPLAAAEEARTVLLADSSKGRLAVVGPGGETRWEASIGPLHDLHVLPTGNYLFQTDWQTLQEVDPDAGETVWTYDAGDAAPDGYEGRVEVHAFQRLENGRTMFALSGPGVLVEVTPEGEVAKSWSLKVGRPDPHHDTRLVRRLDNGHTLAVHESDGAVREYDGEGKLVWEYEVPLADYPSGEARPRAGGHGPDAFGNQAFSAVRLDSGNTLIGTGNGHAVIEVTPEKEVVWSLGQRELPGVILAWVTTLEVLPSGNIVIGNCHAGTGQPQLVEVDRDKTVVWTLRDHERFGNATTNSQVLEVNGEDVVGRTRR